MIYLAVIFLMLLHLSWVRPDLLLMAEMWLDDLMERLQRGIEDYDDED